KSVFACHLEFFTYPKCVWRFASICQRTAPNVKRWSVGAMERWNVGTMPVWGVLVCLMRKSFGARPLFAGVSPGPPAISDMWLSNKCNQ
ncbi:hypothetical protein M5D96_004055, partial [Drosophila gunungcola]